MGRSLAVVLVTALAVGVGSLAAPARAQPAEPQPDEIEMEPEPAGSGSGSGSAAAEPTTPTKDPKAAKKWLYAAQTLVQKGDYWTRAKRLDDAKAQYENAATAFQKSIESGDDLNTYYLLADVEDKLGKSDLAAAHCRKVVKAQTGVRPDVMKKATAKLDELTTKIGIVTLTVVPEGTTITLAGTELGKSPLPEPLLLMPGNYALAFSADGYQPKEAELKIEAGSESERTIELEAVKIIVEPPAPREPEPAEMPMVTAPPSKLPLYIGAGATGALLLTWGITGILAIGQHGTYTANESTPVERADAKTNGERLALVSDLTLIGGLGAAGFTAYWYLYKYRRGQQKPAAEQPAPPRAVPPVVRRHRDESHYAKVVVAPWVQPEASGLAIVGAF